ncbi:hypothetical protein EDD98_5771 [Streptomyces sp. PanSC19]|uniref:hypothetical protein n=1 Tax=Streptomyces sp. PanSC19 TaxID=1520455 RepID=UPI000FAB22E5|nr:hypothetical protein [Streptomyces sp. PanSC19]ROQ26159.1 hypothetical protein EDD98_5771 [Streptomyces sp. PanSC19]
MPRRRPGRIRADAPGGHRTTGARLVIDGLSSRALSEIIRLERTRNYLQPGDVSAAVRLWRDYVHQPERALWHDYEWGNVHWYCCGNPLEARALLDTVMQAISPRSARELRKIVSRSDADWNLPSPPYAADGR